MEKPWSCFPQITNLIQEGKKNDGKHLITQNSVMVFLIVTGQQWKRRNPTAGYDLLKAASTAQIISVALCFVPSTSGSSSTRSLARFIAISYLSSVREEKTFSSTSEEWASTSSASVRLSIRWGSFTHRSRTLSWSFFTSRCFSVVLVTGWVVMSNRRKFCFSVVRIPFSTRFFAILSLTFLSWYCNLKGFQVSPMGKINRMLEQDYKPTRFQKTSIEYSTL